MTSINNTVYKQVKEAMEIIRTNVEAASDADSFHIDIDKERESLQRQIDELANFTLIPLLIKLKKRLNGLVTINRLPLELLTNILLLTNLGLEEENSYPYMPYTWVCHHWRSLLIQNPAFWTLIRLRPINAGNRDMEPFYHELFRRSQSSQLDVVLLCNSLPFKPILDDLFDKYSNRIRSLHLSNEHQELTRLVLSGKHFPLLKEFALTDRLTISHQIRSLSRLLPILAASNYLETFECTLDEKDWGAIQKDQIALILSRIRNLNLTVYSPIVAQSVLDLLHNNAKLQSLQFITSFRTVENNFSGVTVFPELEYLSIDDASLVEHIQAPKLSSLDASQTFSSDIFDFPILEKFDFSSIRYFYIRDKCPRHNAATGYCILGTKGRDIQCENLFSARTGGGNIFSRTYPTDCFHLSFRKVGEFDRALKTTLSSMIPRLTNLVELHSLSPHIFSVFLQELTSGVPSIQKLIVRSSNGLLDFLCSISNSSQCPRLKCLSYTTLILPKDLEEYADKVGEKLTNSLQSRHCNTLKSIDLGNCPPLPEIWLQELRKLGIDVVTQKVPENVVIKSRNINLEEWTYL